MSRARWGGTVALLIGGAVLLAIVLWTSQGGACEQARQARTIAVTSPVPQDRAAALSLYLVKKAECEAAGGSVRSYR